MSWLKERFHAATSAVQHVAATVAHETHAVTHPAETLAKIDPSTVAGRTMLARGVMLPFTGPAHIAGFVAGKGTLVDKANKFVTGREVAVATASAEHPVATLEVVAGAALVATGVGATAGSGLLLKGGSQFAAVEVAHEQLVAAKKNAAELAAAQKAAQPTTAAEAAAVAGAHAKPLTFLGWLVSLVHHQKAAP